MSRIATIGVPAPLRYALHGLMIVLVVFLAVLARPGGPVGDVLALGGAVAFGVWYCIGVWAGHRTRTTISGATGTTPRAGRGLTEGLWLLGLVLLWFVLLWRLPAAGFLAFALFFVFMYLVPGHWPILAVAVAAAVVVTGFGRNEGWSAGVIVGPVLGAVVALMIGFGYTMLTRQSCARERLVAELVQTQEALATTERNAGVVVRQDEPGRGGA